MLFGELFEVVAGGNAPFEGLIIVAAEGVKLFVAHRFGQKLNKSLQSASNLGAAPLRFWLLSAVYNHAILNTSAKFSSVSKISGDTKGDCRQLWK